MDLPPAPAPERPATRLRRAGGWVLLGCIWLAGGAVTALAVVEWRTRTETAPAAARMASRQDELATRQGELANQQGELANQQAQLRVQISQLGDAQSELNRRIQQVEQAATEARLLIQGGAGTATLGEKIRQIDALAAALETQKADTGRQLADLQRSLEAQVGRRNEETAAVALAQVRWRSLLTRAQSQVLKAQIDLAEGNRGLAREELGAAVKTLQTVEPLLGDAGKTELKGVLEAAEQARTAMILESPTVRSNLGILWNRTGQLLAGQ